MLEISVSKYVEIKQIHCSPSIIIWRFCFEGIFIWQKIDTKSIHKEQKRKKKTKKAPLTYPGSTRFPPAGRI